MQTDAADEQMLLMGLLEDVEMELGIEFTAAEFKAIREYLKNNPNADPATIFAEIFSIAKKKTNKAIDAEKTKKLQKRLENSKLFALRARQAPIKIIGHEQIHKPTNAAEKKLTDKEIRRIVDAAEKKLLDKKIIKGPLNEAQKTNAAKYFQTYAKDSDTPIGKANIALLGVICVGVAGGIRPVVLQNWGNLIGVPDLNPYHGESTLDQGNKIDHQLGDPIGLEARAITRVIMAGNIDPGVAGRLLNEAPDPALDQGGGRGHIPTLKPKGSNPLDPFD